MCRAYSYCNMGIAHHHFEFASSRINIDTFALAPPPMNYGFPCLQPTYVAKILYEAIDYKCVYI
jgi:hypothetical protein